MKNQTNQEQKVQQKIQGQTYLQTTIQCITQRQKYKKQFKDTSISTLYKQVQNVLNDLDQNIKNCKTYNITKIFQEYQQHQIRSLKQQIKKLQDTLKLQKDARSPTKKHISDILEKLVQLRTQNQRLNKQNNELKHKMTALTQQNQINITAIQKLQSIQAKGAVQRLPPISGAPTIVQSVKQFLKDKQQVRKITGSSISSLQKFLNQIRPKMWNFQLGNLLQQIDKWVDGTQTTSQPDVDMWRIRSSIARKFSDYMDNPQSLVKPSVRASDSLWTKLQQKNNSKSHKFSYLGSKRSLNASFQ